MIVYPKLLTDCLAGQYSFKGIPGGSDDKESSCNAGDPGSIPGSGRSPGEGNGNLTPVFLPGKPHRQMSLMGCSPWDCKESDTIELLTHTHILEQSYQKYHS